MQSGMQSKRAGSRKKNQIGKGISIILLTILFLIALGLGVYVYRILNLDTFYAGVMVDGVALKGMTLEQGYEAIQDHHQPDLDAIKLVLRHEDHIWEYGYEDIGANINVEEVVSEAYQVGRQGNIFRRLKEIRNISRNPRNFSTTLIYDVSLLQDELEAIAQQINIQPVDAEIEFHPDNNEKFTFTKEVVGKGMLVEQAIADLQAKMNSKDFTPYEIPVEQLNPQYTLDEVKTWTSRIAVYSTKLSGTSQRIYNITLSSKSFDGLRLNPGEVFSLNDTTGPRDKKHGYLDAPVIVGGKKLEDEPGGGNCQTSTTLYGAALRADLEIVERWNHSWPSGYTTVGQDATVNYPTADIKFKNNKDTPVFFNRYISGGRLYIEVYGKAPTEYDSIDVVSIIISQTETPPETVVRDNTLQPGEEVIEYKSRPGIKVQTYRVYYKDKKEIKRVKEALSSYPRIIGKKRVGPPKPPEPEPEQELEPESEQETEPEEND